MSKRTPSDKERIDWLLKCDLGISSRVDYSRIIWINTRADIDMAIAAEKKARKEKP